MQSRLSLPKTPRFEKDGWPFYKKFGHSLMEGVVAYQGRVVWNQWEEGEQQLPESRLKRGVLCQPSGGVYRRADKAILIRPIIAVAGVPPAGVVFIDEDQLGRSSQPTV